MSQPVHGFWGGAAHWGKVIIELDRRGYGSLHAVENPLTSLADDARRTQVSSAKAGTNADSSTGRNDGARAAILAVSASASTPARRFPAAGL